MIIQQALFLLPGLLVGITVHEAAHAASAKWLGDETAEKMGRLTLNPLKHLSLLGTVALFAVGFGWGKPVMINAQNFRKPKLHYLLSSLAGPASNLLLCALALGILYLHPPGIIELICLSIFYINAILAVINLLPIPPLDGSKIWPCIIPGFDIAVSEKWSGIWIVILLICVFTGVIGRI